MLFTFFFFFSSRRRHTRFDCDWSSDVCSSDLKLGVLLTERGDPAQGKQMIEAALHVRPGLIHADYNLGRAEMLLGNDAAAIEHFERATKSDSDPDVLEQSWYRLGTVLRRMHRTQEAQQAFAMFQKVKDAEAEASQQSLIKFKNRQSPNAPEPPPSPDKPR